MTSHIHPTKSDKTTILKEYPKEYIKEKDTPYYPIFTDGNQEKYDKYLEHSQSLFQQEDQQNINTMIWLRELQKEVR